MPRSASTTTSPASEGPAPRAPAASRRSPISSYWVFFYTRTGTETFLTTLGNVTSWTNTGLANGTTYYYKVSALNAIGEGGLSNERSAILLAQATVPGAPSLTSATPGNGQVSLAWGAPASNGGSAITSYTAPASPAGSTCASAGTSCTVIGLSNCTSYSFTVRATNAIGTGSPSN